jgi:hypothetical protein
VTAPATRWENPSEPWWPYSGTKPETADTAKESLQLLGLLYSEQETLSATSTSSASKNRNPNATQCLSADPKGSPRYS